MESAWPSCLKTANAFPVEVTAMLSYDFIFFVEFAMAEGFQSYANQAAFVVDQVSTLIPLVERVRISTQPFESLESGEQEDATAMGEPNGIGFKT